VVTHIPHITSMRPEPARDNYGRYVLPDPATGTDRSWTRATTVAHTLDDTHHLTQWKRRMVLQGLAAETALLAGVNELAEELAAAGDDWRKAKPIKQQMDMLCDAAAEVAGAGDGANWGTLLHTITEYADAGRLNEIMPSIGSWGEPGENLLRDLLCRCTGIVMHLPVGKATCQLYELDLIAGWDAAQAAHTVRQFRDRGKGMGRAYTPPATATGDRVLTLIASANHPSALVALYRDLKSRGEHPSR
jgi:hypothetical protein